MKIRLHYVGEGNEGMYIFQKNVSGEWVWNGKYGKTLTEENLYLLKKFFKDELKLSAEAEKKYNKKNLKRKVVG